LFDNADNRRTSDRHEGLASYLGQNQLISKLNMLRLRSLLTMRKYYYYYLRKFTDIKSIPVLPASPGGWRSGYCTSRRSLSSDSLSADSSVAIRSCNSSSEFFWPNFVSEESLPDF